MPAPKNPFKQGLRDGTLQIGCWLGLADPYVAENRAGLEALDDILGVEGLDGVFIGPSDLAADMGLIGQLDVPEVKAAVLGAVRRIAASGKAAGVLTLDPAMQRECRDAGASFIATDIDVMLFARSMRCAAENAVRHLK